MKSHKQLWVGALSLSAVIAVGLALTHTTKVQAAKHPVKTQSTIALPALYLASPAFHSAASLDEDGPVRVGETRTIFPPVEEFTLTPPNLAAGIAKTILTVRFPEAQAAALAPSIPMTLANQNVILRRLPTASNIFITSLNFNWQRFSEEQALRKTAASQGKMIPVFNGRHFVRTEPMQFVEPAQIEHALQSHQPIHLTGDVMLASSTVNVFPDHELAIVNTAVVEDTENGQGRTYDQCITQGSQGNPQGAWTFNTLMTAIACSGNNPNCTAQPSQQNQRIAENMLLGMLNSFGVQQTVNSFPVYARPEMGQPNSQGTGFTGGLLANWPLDGTGCSWNNGSSTVPSACPSLPNAPIRLNAIVNRLDLGTNGLPFPPAGELRFVFSVTANPTNQGTQGSCGNNGSPTDVFNIILEYNVPSNTSALTWAQKWNALEENGSFDGTYLGDLQAITDLVVTRTACGGGSCIAQVRSNEIALQGPPINDDWEMREFHFHFDSNGNPVLFPATVAQTPDPQFNNNSTTPPGNPNCAAVNNPNGTGPCTPGTLASYINAHLNPTFLRTNGAAPPVSTNWPTNGPAFLGGSSLNPGGSFWMDNGILSPEGTDRSRIDFSSNTCNGCHGGETATDFQQVLFRRVGFQSALSSFLLGCTTGNGPCPSSNCPLSTENLGQNTNGPCVETVTDPNTTGGSGVTTAFGDIARRVTYLQTVCGDAACDGGTGDDLLLPFTNKPIGVH